MILWAAVLAAGAVTQPPEDGRVLPWIVSVLATALAGTAGVAWRSVREDLKAERAAHVADVAAERAETKAARAELKELNDALLRDVVPLVTRSTDVTARATEALLDRGRR